MNLSDRIRQHEFIKFLDTNGAPATQLWFDEIQKSLAAGKPGLNVPLKLADEQNYLWRVKAATEGVLRATERLEQSKAFLGMLKSGAGPTIGIPLTKEIEYHLASYSITATSLTDLVLVLATQVLRLGIPPKECKWHIVTKNDWVVWTGVGEELRKIDQFVNRYRKLRNPYVHAGSNINVGAITGDPKYEIYAFLEFVHAFQAQNPISIDEAVMKESREILEGGYTTTLEKTCRAIDEDIRKWEELLTVLLEKLLPPLKLWFGMNEGIRSMLPYILNNDEEIPGETADKS